jgi:ABC-type nitrate/sulfonate/bicarbonate transport system substrate-binding protein
VSKGKLLAVCVVWLVIFGVVALAWKLIVTPSKEQAKKEGAEKARQERLEQTSASSRYDHEIRLALDSFSGYAVLRSKSLREELAKKRIKLDFQDDNADYPQRLRKLADGDVQMAAFTVDALIKASAQLGEVPATIVAIIDETRGADAMVAYRDAIPNVDALNDAGTKFILVPDSPSETLARVVTAHFNLDQLSADPFVQAENADDVFDRYKKSRPETHQVFVLWEPYVSRILENPETHVVVDSSRFRGYIVDVIVVSRDYLFKNREIVSDFVEAYFRAVYAHRDEMVQLVLDDAKTLGEPLTKEQAERLVEGVWWKNTQENFAHLGQLQGGRLQHLEDMIGNITDVLLTTGAIASDPTDDQPNLLYYDKILADLKAAGFHPGLDVEKIRDETAALPRLDARQWETLVPVGTLQVPPLVFARGTSKLSSRSRIVLDDLIEKLAAWPQYYLLIRGNASLQGDLEANKALAETRAAAAAEYLTQNGVSQNRVRAVGGEPSGTTSVTFVLGQTPY